MAETTLPDVPRGYTFEDVWAALMEDRERLKEWKEENAQQQKKRDEVWEKNERRQKRLDKQMGDLHRRFGQIAEHLVAPGIAKRFNELGYRFDGIAKGGYRILDEQGNTKTEVDILLEDGDCIVAVEVKATPALKHVEHHVKRLELLRESRNKKNDKRIIRGAIAGAIFGNAEKEATLEAGMYVLEQSGDTMKMEIPRGFVPREW